MKAIVALICLFCLYSTSAMAQEAYDIGSFLPREQSHESEQKPAQEPSRKFFDSKTDQEKAAQRLSRANSAAKPGKGKGQKGITGAFSGNVETRKYHRNGCRYFDCGACIKKFRSREEARKAGYVACKVCGG